MMKFPVWKMMILLICIPGLTPAQPPEELSPEDMEEAGYYDEDSFDTVEPAPVAQPLSAPATPTPAAAPEEKTVRGVKLSPSLGIYPIGYDSININGAESGRYFVKLIPSIGLSSLFKTGSDRELTFSASYTLTYREYFNKGPTLRDFQNEVDGSLGINWTDRVSSDMYGYFLYFIKSGPDTAYDNALYFASDAPRFTFKAMDNLTFKLSLWTQYVELLDWTLGFGDLGPPSDLDDIRRGDITQPASGYPNFDSPFYSGTYLGDVDAEERFWAANLGTNSSVAWTAIPGTTISLEYKFVFEGFSNVQGQEWRGHYIKPSISQTLPWSGGRISLTDEVRLRVYKHSQVEGVARQNFRNRLTVSLSQAINELLTWKFFYRWQMTGENRDNYSDKPNNHWFFTGVDFSF